MRGAIGLFSQYRAVGPGTSLIAPDYPSLVSYCCTSERNPDGLTIVAAQIFSSSFFYFKMRSSVVTK